MAELTAKEFVKLPREEQERRAHELSSHESFLLRTVYSVPKAESIGKFERTEEERVQSRHDFENILKGFGILKEGETSPEENWLDKK